MFLELMDIAFPFFNSYIPSLSADWLGSAPVQESDGEGLPLFTSLMVVGAAPVHELMVGDHPCPQI